MGKRVLGAAVAAVLVGSAIVSVVLLARQAQPKAGRSDSAAAVPLPEPHTLVRHGVTYTAAPASPGAAALDPADSRTVIVYALDVEQPEQPECTWTEPTARLVGESDTTVRIATFDYVVPAVGDEVRRCGWTRDDGDPSDQYRAIRVELDRPLGNRALVDERSGEVIGMLDRDYVPKPAYVPAGFEPEEGVGHFTAEDSFVVSHDYQRRSDSSSLEVHVRSTTAWSQNGEVLGRDEVAGTAATLTEEDYQRCVSWKPKAGLVAEVCSLSLGNSGYLPAEELLRIARSIPPLTG